MKRLDLHILFLFIALCLLGSYPTLSANDRYDEEAVMSRIKNLSIELVSPRYDRIVRSYIQTYTIKEREKARLILGKRTLYFSLFEKYLKEEGLPTELKYLAVVESALKPDAVSRSGAVGLWQMMPETARAHGLRIDEMVDERRDPHKATKAAAEHLKHLYERLGNWELAIAAYNSGGGRVSRAVAKAGSRDFWKVRELLPQETRNYVPAYIAAAYLMQFYDHHDLQPLQPDYDLQLTETAKVYERYTFYEIAQLTGLGLDLIEQLNPAYRKGIIPASSDGNYLILPRRVMPAFEDFRKFRIERGILQDSDAPVFVHHPAGTNSSEYERSLYIVQRGERLTDIARATQLCPYQLMAWNDLPEPAVKEGQELMLIHPRKILQFHRPGASALSGKRIAALPMRNSRAIYQLTHDRFFVRGDHLYFRVLHPSHLLDLANVLPDITVSALLQMNPRLRESSAIKAGENIRVREL